MWVELIISFFLIKMLLKHYHIWFASNSGKHDNTHKSLCLIWWLQGGLAPGGFNFDAKLLVPNIIGVPWIELRFNRNLADMELFYGGRRRESTDVEDMFIAHISGMDTMARGLRNVAKLIEVTGNIMAC